MMRMIAALDSRRGLATDDGIPWDLPSDKHLFVDETAEGLILMGYGTYVEFSSPMHGRTNFVATRRAERLRDGFVAVPDAARFVRDRAGERINNIGGAGLFATTLAMADELVLTRIDADFQCTKFFPAFEDAFVLATRSDEIEENGVRFAFETWRPAAGGDQVSG